MRFADRVDAGRRLAVALEHLRGDDVVVLGLPRGGVPVAAQVAAALGAPLDVIVVRKLGTPGHEELGMGAIGEGGVRVLNDDIVSSVGASAEEIAAVEAAERAELERRASRFRGDRQRLDLTGKTAIVVDDGIATGSTAIAALQVAGALGATKRVLATPVAPHGIERRIADHADEFVALDTPRWFSAVGQFYGDFDQTTDAEVIACLAEGR
jgi:putative phosphoribosyl transferase